MTWVADTSWLYALFDEADYHHRTARSEAMLAEPVAVPEAILAETLDLMRYRHGKPLAKKALEGLGRLPHFAIGEGVPHADSAAEWRCHAGLSYADATAVALARRKGLKLRTFDRRQAKALESAEPR